MTIEGTPIPTYKFSLSGLDAADSDGNEYTYFVKEDIESVPEGYEFAFYKMGNVTDQDKGMDGCKIVNRTVDSYELPETGGPGTGIITILGSILILLGAGVLLLRRRKESL